MSDDLIKDNINIYLNRDSDKDKVLSGASPQEKYIILMNDTLQADNKRLTKQISELETQVEEFEGDIERMDKGKACLKGMLNNFNEIDKLSREVVKIEKEMRCDTVNFINTYRNRTTKLLRILESALVVVFAISYYFSISASILVSIVIILSIADAESTISCFQAPRFPLKEARLKEIAKEIIEANKGQDYIHELIESH